MNDKTNEPNEGEAAANGAAPETNGAAPEAGAATGVGPEGAPGEGAPGAGQAIAPQLRVITQFIRDLSFENPSAPASLSAEAQQGQEVNVGVDVQARKLQNNQYEAMLNIQAAVKKGDQAHFIVELAYSGIFLLENIPEGADHAIMLIEAPRILFPFARRIVADTTRDGGFAPLLLDPIDFAALYRQQMAQQQGEQLSGQAAPTGTA